MEKDSLALKYVWDDGRGALRRLLGFLSFARGPFISGGGSSGSHVFVVII